MTTAARRYSTACALGGAAAFGVFLWFLWAAPGGFLDETPFGLSRFYEEQARAWFEGRWDADAHSYFIERITVDGRYYMYFGPWPSLLRVPVLAFTSSYDGQLTRFSLLLALVVLLAGVGRLVWQVRALHDAGEVSRREQLAVAAFLLAVGCGTSVVLLSASVWVYDEAILWGAAWAAWSLSWCIQYLVGGAVRVLAVASLTTTLAIWSRPSSGVIGVVVLGGVFGGQILSSFRQAWVRRLATRLVRFAGFDEQLARRRPWPAGFAASVPVAAYAAVNWAKFGAPFSVPFDRQDVVNDVNPLRRAVLEANGSDLLALDEIPTNLLNYFRPDGISLHRLFPFIDFSDGVVVLGSPARDIEWLHASLTVTATLLLVFGAVGLAALLLPRLSAPGDRVRFAVLRLPALATIASLLPTLMFPSVFQRYNVDFTPVLVLLGAMGMYVTRARLRGRRKAQALAAAVAAVLLAWNLAANLALTANLQRGYLDFVDPSDRGEWVLDRIRWTERLGVEPVATIVRWDRVQRSDMPPTGPIGSFLVVDDCRELMLSDGSRWLPIRVDEPHSICDALAG